MTDARSRVVTELLVEHGALREIMKRCERLGDELEVGRIEIDRLVVEVTHLRTAFDAHNLHEEQLLRSPSFGELDALGDLRIDQMISGHLDEHRLVRVGLGNAITGALRLTLDRLRCHLAEEERHFVTSKVLRDVVVETSE